MKASEAKSFIDAALQPLRALERASVVFDDLAAAEQQLAEFNKNVAVVKKEQEAEIEKLEKVKAELAQAKIDAENTVRKASEEAEAIVDHAHKLAAEEKALLEGAISEGKLDIKNQKDVLKSITEQVANKNKELEDIQNKFRVQKEAIANVISTME